MIPMEQPHGYISPTLNYHVFFWGFLHHRWSLFSRGAIPSTQRLGHRNFHLHTWQQKLPAACKFREDFLTGSLKISPQKPTKKKTWHFSMYSSFRIWGTENGEPRCAHHETQARNPQQKIRRYDWNNKILFFTYQMATTSVLGMVGCQD